MISKLKHSKIARALHKAVSSRKVSTAKLLAGADNGVNPLGFAFVSGNILWTSTTLESTPHCQLLRDYQKLGIRVFEPEIFQKTPYWKHATRHVQVVGKYRGATNEKGIVETARCLIALYEEVKSGKKLFAGISVRAIADSDCFQLASDLFLAAAAVSAGNETLRVNVGWSRVQTALQQLLGNVLWFTGNRELYQPIDAPELKQSWPLTRKCSDRFGKMKKFLMTQEQYQVPDHKKSYLDLGSFYGWFASQMSSLGFVANGIELDPIAIQVGVACYGLSPNQLKQGDIPQVLKDCEPFDVMSCLSVLHHFVAGAQSVSADELIKCIDQKTRHILFFDTGEEHEGCVHGALPGWNPDFIEKWVMERTSFKKAYRLGVDEDATFPHQNDYGRMLFAFVK